MTFFNNYHQGSSSTLKASSENMPFCIAVGFSAGGFEALKELLGNLPAGTDNFSVILSHPLENTQFNILESQLSGNPVLKVRRPAEGATLTRGNIYAAMPDEEVGISEGKISIRQSRRAAEGLVADALFLSVAVSMAEKSIAVILSGMGNDGSAGVKSVKAAGGKVLVQRPETSKYDGMPKAAISTGCADSVLAPGEIAKMIGSIINQQSLSLRDDALNLGSPEIPQARLAMMQLPVVSVETMVKETLYASYQHTYIITNRDCRILEISGDAALYLNLNKNELPCNLYDILKSELTQEVKLALTDAINHGVLNKGKLEIFELDNKIVFIRIMVKRFHQEKDENELFVLIFENLNPEGFTAEGIHVTGKLSNGPEFQAFAKRILATAKGGSATGLASFGA